MTTYVSVGDVLLDSLGEIPDHKSYFVGMYTQRPTGVVIKFNPVVNKYVKEIENVEPDYFEILDEFINLYMAKHYNMRSITPEVFHRVICLSVIMPDLVNFLQKHSDDIVVFKSSQYFLRYASMRNVPLDFFPHLAFMLITDEMSYHIKNVRDKEQRKRLEKRFDAQKMLAVNSFMILMRYAKLSKEKFSLADIEPKPTDIILHKNRTYGIRLFEGSNALVNIIIADRGCGKTIALLRIIYAVINMGYTVIIFGNDLRKEFRFASFPLAFAVNQSMNDILHQQKEKAHGLPITVYCDEPKFPIERDIKDFDGKPKEWNSLSGVVLFESDDVTEKVVEVERDEFLEGGRRRTKIYRKHRLSLVIDSFIKWRSDDRTKKIVLCLNEAQRFIGSVVDQESWGLFHSAEKLFTEIRGLGVPVIMNTQYISRIKKSGQQFDVLYGSLLTSPTERRKLSEIYNIKNLKSLLAIPTIKPEHVFFKVEYGKTYKIRFLVPPCMPENSKYSLEDLFGGKTRLRI